MPSADLHLFVVIAIAALVAMGLGWKMYADARDGRINPLRGLVLGILVIVGILWFAGALDEQIWQHRR